MPLSEPQPSAALLRQALKAWRASLPASVVERHSLQAAQHLLRQPFYRRARRLACYMAADGELSCQPLMTAAWQQGKEVYLPVLHRRARRLHFARFAPGQALVRNRFGLLEPTTKPYCPPWALDLVLMPLVGFDLAGHRLGMGGGYYDRTFENVRLHGFGPRLLGWAHQGQCVSAGLPAQPWDVPVRGVVTEAGFWQR